MWAHLLAGGFTCVCTVCMRLQVNNAAVVCARGILGVLLQIESNLLDDYLYQHTKIPIIDLIIDMMCVWLQVVTPISHR